MTIRRTAWVVFGPTNSPVAVGRYYHWLAHRLPALMLLKPLLEHDTHIRLLVDFRFDGAAADNPWVPQVQKLARSCLALLRA